MSDKPADKVKLPLGRLPLIPVKGGPFSDPEFPVKRGKFKSLEEAFSKHLREQMHLYVKNIGLRQNTETKDSHA